MRINFNNFSLHYQKIINNKNNKKAILFLHGFTGSSKDWQGIANRITKKVNLYFIDLIGHGKSDSPNNVKLYEIDSVINQLLGFTKKINEKNIFVLGYSMGGRVALNFAIKHSGLFTGLLLESTSAGLKSKSEREKRINNDEKLAKFINSHSVDEFVDYWISLDIFKTQRNLPEEKLKKLRNEKIKNDKIGLINSLKGFGTGRMQPLYSEIKNIQLETLLITGELDKKYSELNSKMKDKFPRASHKIIDGTGHNTHLENPYKFAVTVNEFIRKF